MILICIIVEREDTKDLRSIRGDYFSSKTKEPQNLTYSGLECDTNLSLRRVKGSKEGKIKLKKGLNRKWLSNNLDRDNFHLLLHTYPSELGFGQLILVIQKNGRHMVCEVMHLA